MELVFSIILSMCSVPSVKDIPACQEKYTKCVDWISEQKEVKEKNVTKDTIAMWIATSEKIKNDICK